MNYPAMLMVQTFAPEPAPAEADAGRRNMRLLIQLRWLAVGGQLATIEIVYGVMAIEIPLVPLLGAIAALVAVNLASVPLVRRRSAVTNAELTAGLLFDVAVLAWQLYFSGGLANPFASLFLLQVVLGAILLKPSSSWGVVVAALAALLFLGMNARPLALPHPFGEDPMTLYLKGSLICFLIIAVLLVAFITRVTRNLSERDAALAAIRQRAAEEDHIVRMGLLASGAAHELGTPLSTLSVVLGDLKVLPRSTTIGALTEDVDEMEAAVARCKAIVGGILMSAGEARGEAPRVTTVRTFLEGIVNDWQSRRLPGTFDYVDHFGEDMAIVSDPALKQVIGNIIDNAAEFSPGWVRITAERLQDALSLEIADRGPGFSSEILSSFGQPYRSTKGRPGGGLGLFLLVNVVRKLGGEARAGNRPEGGAWVRVTLPLAALAYGTMGQP